MDPLPNPLPESACAKWGAMRASNLTTQSATADVVCGIVWKYTVMSSRYELKLTADELWYNQSSSNAPTKSTRTCREETWQNKRQYILYKLPETEWMFWYYGVNRKKILTCKSSGNDDVRRSRLTHRLCEDFIHKPAKAAVGISAYISAHNMMKKIWLRSCYEIHTLFVTKQVTGDPIQKHNSTLNHHVS